MLALLKVKVTYLVRDAQIKLQNRTKTSPNKTNVIQIKLFETDTKHGLSGETKHLKSLFLHNVSPWSKALLL